MCRLRTFDAPQHWATADRDAGVAAALEMPAASDVAAVDSWTVAIAWRALPDEIELARLADLRRALSGARRSRHSAALGTDGANERSVSEVASLIDVSASAVSRSLRMPRDLGFVRRQKEGETVHYALEEAHVAYFVSKDFLSRATTEGVNSCTTTANSRL